MRWAFVLLAILRFTTSASALSLSGVTEGSKCVLTAFASTTNLSVSAVPGPGSTQVALMLEANGSISRQLTIGSPFSITFSNLPAGKYFLAGQAVGDPADAADLSFDIQPASLRPANDDRDQAMFIIALDLDICGTNTFATSEPSEPVHAQNGCGRSLWWKWQAASSQTISATTVGSSFDTVLAIYTLTNNSNLLEIAANDDAGFSGRFSQVTFHAAAGTTYLIAVDGAQTPDGSATAGRAKLRLAPMTAPEISSLTPTNGYSRLVLFPSATADIPIGASVSDASGIARVDYRLGGSGIDESGLLFPPYQKTLNHLPPGDYLLSVQAENTVGLVSSEHASFSIVNAAPELHLLERFSAVVSKFGFGITGFKGATYELQAAADLSSWNLLVTFTNFDGAVRVWDTNAGFHAKRFYRVMTP